MSLRPIDDLIEHLKGKTPYGKTEALKLYEALKTLSDGITRARSISTKQIALGAITSDELAGNIVLQLTGKSTFWNTNIVFSASDNDTVAWTAGTIKFNDGSLANILAGNTGNMTGLTYIYYYPSVSNSVLQITTNYANVVGDDRILLCIANKTTDATQSAFFVPAVGTFGINETVIGPNSISTGKVQALAITTGLLAANSVTAAKINVAQLSAISVDAGFITAGTLTGTVIRTSSGDPRVQIDTTNGLIVIDSGGNTTGQITAAGLIKFQNIIPVVATTVMQIGDTTSNSSRTDIINGISPTGQSQISVIAGIAGNGIIGVYTQNTLRVIIDNNGLTLNSGVFNGSGASITSISASNLSSGTVPDARFPSTLPALNGSALTNLNATNLASGTISDSRQGTNVPLKNQANTFSADQSMSAADWIFGSGRGIRDSGSNSSFVVTSTVAQIYASGGTQVAEFGTGALKLYVSGGFRTILTFNDGAGHNVLYY